MKILCLNIKDIANITVKVVYYCCIIHDITKFEAIYLLENSVLDNCGIYKMHINIKNRISNYSNSLYESEKLETGNFSIDEKNYEDLVTYFTKCVSSKLIKMLSLHYPELIGKIEEHKGKKILVSWWLYAS